jgi:hypothetical protein
MTPDLLIPEDFRTKTARKKILSRAKNAKAAKEKRREGGGPFLPVGSQKLHTRLALTGLPPTFVAN